MTLVLREATRRFGDVVALNRVTLHADGGITALVGPNGAGKSTFMRLVTGHVRPTSGTVQAFGMDVWDNPDVMRRVGYVPEQDAFYERMSGLEFVQHLACLHGLDWEPAGRQARAELEDLGLGDAMERPIKTYSKGMRQRVKLAQALLHRPRLLLLDEPMLGCDPLARRRIHERVLALRDQGCTIVVSSHILPEMERLTRDIAILHGGRIVARGNAAQVRDALSQVPSRVRLLTPVPRTVAADVAAWDDVEGVRLADAHVDVETRRLRDFLVRIHEGPPAKWRLRGHRTLDADLDSVFRYVSEASA
ncbi:MAG TPA: ABC transporter ATP-binding protein [Candidatus Thermoplasmatota archaeon]|nr:ABC transporter ATP-binding protein [Candidatus Thermoplasmatota archaeon]